MVHTRMSAIGWVVGGAQTVVTALLDGFGPGSPLAKLVEADGQVLLLGAPLDRLTILHHAESLVDSPQKRMAHHEIPVREGGEVVWRDVFDHDTSTALGAFPYERAVGDQDPFAVIGQLALDAGCGITGMAGNAVSHCSRPDRWCASASNG
jgi:aminoglycoside 3-N-acetyltransferase